MTLAIFNFANTLTDTSRNCCSVYDGKSKEYFLKNTFEDLLKVLKGGVRLKADDIFVSGDIAVASHLWLTSTSTALNGKPFSNTYSWVLRFANGVITEVRAYVDSFLAKAQHH